MTPDLSTEGFKPPPVRAFTENERGWITFLRLVSSDTDPPPTLAAIQAVRVCLGKRLQGRGTG